MLSKDMNGADVKTALVLNDRAEVIILHDKPFKKNLSWLEYDIDGHRLDLVMNDGDIRNFGIPVNPQFSEYLRNSFQVLMARIDDKTGEPIEGNYLPLIIHTA